MSNDKFQDKYNEIFHEMKEEKMNWDFEDFLKTAEKQDSEPQTLPIQKKNGGTYPKIFWLAASVVMILGLVLFLKYLGKSEIQKKDELVKNQIEQQKNSGALIDTLSINRKTVAINDTVKNSLKDSLEADSATVENNISIDKLLPKRGRLKRNSKAFLVQNTADTANSRNADYQSGYVIINGHKIDNEKEAIDVAKYSFQMLSDKVAETVATTDRDLSIDY